MKKVTIEALVRWAWTEELPKAEPGRLRFFAPPMLGIANPWANMAGGGSGGGSVRINDFCAVWDPDATGTPDPDAVTVARAVERLDDMVVVEGDDDFFGAWGDCGTLGSRALARAWDMVVEEARGVSDVLRPLQGRASAIVVRTSLTGKWPDWQGPAPAIVADVWPNGRPKWLRRVRRAVAWDDDGEAVSFDDVEMDGFDPRGRRPYPGAWRAERLVPDPVPVLAERIRWSMVHLWLSTLAAELDGLGGRRVLPPTRPARPWEDGRSVEIETNNRRNA